MAPAGLFPLFFRIYLWAKCEFHMLVNCSLHLKGYTALRPRQGSQSAFSTPHNMIIIEGGSAVLETDDAQREAASRCAQAPVTPPDMCECFLSVCSYGTTQWLRLGKEDYLNSSQY